MTGGKYKRFKLAMTTDLTSDHYTAIRTAIQEELTHRDERLIPGFYAITGSHLYGTASPTSDVDVKGFHCAEGARYMLFDQPKTQHAFQAQLGVDSLEFEVTSYELRKFGEMIEKSHFSIVELVTTAQPIYRYSDNALTSLVDIVHEALPAELPKRYAGMAQSLYERDVNGHILEDQTDAKSWVYALRGCLAAQYVQQHERVEPELLILADAILTPSEYDSVQTFISSVRNGDAPAEAVSADVYDVIKAQIGRLDIAQFSSEERLSYREEIAEWMLDMRTLAGTR